MNSKMLFFTLFIVLLLAIPFSFASDDNIELNQESLAGAADSNGIVYSDVSGDEVLTDDGYTHIYVDASATDEGDGSQQNPYKDFSNITNVIYQDTFVHVAKGNYTFNYYEIYDDPYSGQHEEGYTNFIQVVSNFKIVGEGSGDTIIDFMDGGIFAIVDMGRSYDAVFNPDGVPEIYIQDLTLFNASINSMSYYGYVPIDGTIECVNVIFDSSTSDGETEDGSYGGAISSNSDLLLINCTLKNNIADRGGAIFSLGNATIINCTFINNTASEGGAILAAAEFNIINSTFINNTALEDGGAIYTYLPTSVDGSVFEGNEGLSAGAIYFANCELNVTNSNFTFNFAHSYGGALVAAGNSSIMVSGCNFVNDTTGTSAGAIYCRESDAIFKDSNFTNCSALFGGAICDLDCESSYSNIIFDSNTAVKGGAIYKTYNVTSVTDSNFIDNAAFEGGAVYFDEVYSASLSNLRLINNSATYANDLYYIGDEDDIIFDNVTSPQLFGIKFLDLNRVANDYDIVKINETEVVIGDRYDMRDYNLLTEVKNQKLEGNCWAFASIAALESCIIKANGTVLDLSEENMKNLIASFSEYGSYSSLTNMGGNFFTATGYLASWLGPVYEEDDIYSSNALSLVSNATFHVQNVMSLPRYSYTDNDGIKEAIMKYGAVVTAMYFDESFIAGDNVSYYSHGDDLVRNHAVAIVGWDDNYSKDLFNGTPAGDGAFIVRNSWGPDWGEDGYFYVSYYDEYFAELNNLWDTFVFILNDTNHYDKNYQHEIQATSAANFYTNVLRMKNVFVAEGDELITAVSAYFSNYSNWEITINVNGEFKHSQNGTAAGGFYTFPLTKSIPVKEGDIFEVIVRSAVETNSQIMYFALTYDNDRFRTGNISFYAEGDDGEWKDGNDEDFIIPIKALTVYGKLNTTLNVTGLDEEMTINTNYTIQATAYDQYGDLINDGNVTFIVDGENTTVALENGIANATVSFEEAGEHNISVIFNDMDYYAASNVSEVIEIDPIGTAVSLSLNTTDLLVGDSLKVTAIVNTTRGKIAFYIDNVLVDEIDVDENGSAILLLNNLSYGNYNINANYSDIKETYLNSSNETSFTVNKKEAAIDVDDNITVKYNNDETLDITVSYGNETLAGVNITVTAGNETDNFTTDENGTVSIPLNELDVGSYNVTISVEDDTYGGEKTIAMEVVTVETALSLSLNTTELLVGDSLTVTAVVNTTQGKIAFYIDDILVDEIDVDENGSAILLLTNLSYGNHSITANYSDAKETYLNSSNETSFIVNKKEATLDVDDNITINYNDDASMDIVISYDNETLAGVNVTVTVGNETDNFTTDENGTVSIPLNELEIGSYNVSISIEDDTFAGEKNITIDVNKAPTNINLEVVDIANSSAIISFEVNTTANITPEGVINVTVYKNSTIVYNDSISLNESEFTIYNITEGNYTIDAVYDGDDILDNTSSQINFTAKSIKVNADDLVKYYHSPDKFVVDLANLNGTTAINKTAIVTINGVNYTRTTDENGTLAISINLGSGVYNATITVDDVSVVKEITVLPTVIGEDVVKMFKNATKYTATFLDSEGNYLPENTTVEFNLYGTIYKRTIKGDEGVASLNINLPPGNHTITATNPVTGESCSNNIEVLSLIAENEDLVKYFRNDSQFVVKVLDENGNAVGAGEKVSFNINGVIYTRQTNESGYAKLNINLPQGDYIITTTYNGCSAANNITVLSKLNTSDLSMAYRDGSKFQAKLVDDQGNPFAGQKVSFNINGVFYTRTTNDEGVASLNINLPKGEYIISTSFEGETKSNKITISD